MECSEVRLKLDEFMKNRMDETATKNIKLHLAECHECLEELNILKEINDFLGVECSVRPGAGFTEVIMKSIEKEREKRRFVLGRLPFINLGASLVLTGLLLMLISTEGFISRWSDSMSYGAAAINSGINTTSSSIETLINNIINTGGK